MGLSNARVPTPGPFRPRRPRRPSATGRPLQFELTSDGRLQSNIRAAHPQKANSALSSDSQRSRPSRTGITSLLQFLRCSLAPSRFDVRLHLHGSCLRIIRPPGPPQGAQLLSPLPRLQSPLHRGMSHHRPKQTRRSAPRRAAISASECAVSGNPSAAPVPAVGRALLHLKAERRLLCQHAAVP